MDKNNGAQSETAQPTEREIRLEMLAIMRADGYDIRKDGRGAGVELKAFFDSQMAENVRVQALKNLTERGDGDAMLDDESLGLEK